MKAMFRGGFVCAGLFAGILLGVQPVGAQTFSFPVGGFSTSNVCKNATTPPPACQVLTDGSPKLPTVVTGGVLRLTTATQNQHGAAWFRVAATALHGIHHGLPVQDFEHKFLLVLLISGGWTGPGYPE